MNYRQGKDGNGKYYACLNCGLRYYEDETSRKEAQSQATDCYCQNY